MGFRECLDGLMQVLSKMGEAVVTSLVSKLGDHLDPDKRFKGDLNWLENELSKIKTILKDAERCSSTSESVEVWVAQLKDAAYRTEDVLDDICIKFRCSNKERWKAKLEFYSQFRYIKREIQSVWGRGEAYGLIHAVVRFSETLSGRKKHQVHRIHAAWIEEPEMVGFDEEMMKLRELTLREEKMMNRRNLISIVGMRGSGKSTLARNAYNLVKGYFDCRAWITVSESFQMIDALKHMYKGFCKSGGDQEPPNREMESLDERELKRMICTYLCGKRYLLVLDDMCDLSVWDDLQCALPCNSTSKIILTSPYVMNSLKKENCHLFFMNPLPLESSWKLFCQKAFPYSDPPGVCPEDLIELGHDIVKRCGGLPLAIFLLGNILSNHETHPSHWKYVLNRFNLKVLVHPSLGSLDEILQATYDELPSQLKYCFLYCCTFPRSLAINRKKLIRLWVAERFIEQEGEKELEDIANDYYVLLIERCLLLPIISDFDGESHACKVHDIMHEFGKTRFQNDFGVLGEGRYHQVEQKRRLVIHTETKLVANGEHFKTRSLFVFNGKEFPLSPLTDIPSKLKYLRVLSLEGILMESLPNQVCDLILLRYLGLRGTQLKDLPRSLMKLKDLLTLDVRGTRLRHWSNRVDQLEDLKHLLLSQTEIYGDNNIPDFPYKLHNLRTLSGVSIDKRNTSIDLSRSFPVLEKLDITVWDSVDVCINHLERLSSLKIYYQEMDRNGEQQLENLLPPPCLEKLVLGGVMKQLPQWFGQLKSLRIVRLVNSLLVTDPLSNLSMLPSLVSLSLYHAYTGEQMGCQQGGFPKLRHLHIARLVEFTEWSPIEEGTMPCLKFLSIVNCTKLSMLPQGFEKLKSLQSLEVIEMPDAFMERLMTEDYLKTIPFIKITHMTSVLPHDSHEPATSSQQSREGQQ